MDKLVSDGGLRQRETSNDSASIDNICRNGWDPACGTMCCVEMKWTKDEWDNLLQTHGLPEETYPPRLLQEIVKEEDWNVGIQVDMANLDRQPQVILTEEDQVIFKLRKFIMCDGNHRISGLQQLKVQLFLLTHPPTPSLCHHTYVRSQHRSIRIVRPAPCNFTRKTSQPQIGRSRRRCPSSSCCTSTPNAQTTSSWHPCTSTP